MQNGTHPPFSPIKNNVDSYRYSSKAGETRKINSLEATKMYYKIIIIVTDF